MKSSAAVKTTVSSKADQVYGELSKSVIITFATLSALVGAWGLACFIYGMASLGPSHVFKGFLQAIGL